MKRVLGFLAIVFAAAAFVLLREPDRGVETTTSSVSGTDAAPASPPDAVAELASPRAPESSARQVADSRGTKDGPAATVPVVVLDRDGRVVANAEVYAADVDSDWRAQTLGQSEPGAILDWLTDHGQRSVTDERGGTSVPPPQRIGLVGARTGDAFTYVEVERGVERVTLAFGEESTFDVHVTHADGRAAANVPVVFRSLDHFGLRQRALTDERGVARFRHVRAFVRADVPEPCELTVAWLFAHPPAKRFDSIRDVPTRVELVLPPSGTLEVTLVDESDAPLEGESGFVATMVTDDFETRSLSWAYGPATRGVVVLTPIEVGTECDFSGWCAEPRLRAETRVAAPAQAGETVRLRLKLAPPPAAIFRAIDERGAVLANQRLTMSVRELGGAWGDGDPWSVALTTDARGDFRVPYRDADPDDERVRSAEFFTQREADGTELYFRVELDSAPVFEDRRCGDARFVPSNVIVAGTVLDERGEPAAGIAIRVDEFQGDDQGADRGERGGVSSVRGDDGWLEHPAWPISDAGGRFSVRGVRAAQRLRVVANRGRANESSAQLCAVGAHDVELRVVRAGRLVGSLSMPSVRLDALPRIHWSGRALGDGRVTAADVVGQSAPEPGLVTFEFAELAAGTGTVSITIGPREVARVDDVLVTPGETTRDPRLQRLDVFANQRELVVHVFSPDGSPSPGGIVRTTSSDEPTKHADWMIRRGEARCWVGAGPVDLWVAVPNARRERVTAVASNARNVRLRPSYELELVFRADELPARLVARLEAPGENAKVFTERRSAGGDATVRARFDPSGRCRVLLFAEPTPEQSDTRRLGEWTIEVADVDEQQRFEFTLDPTVLAEVLR